MTSPQVTKTYNLAAVQLIVGTVDISGYSDDGGIEFENAAALFETTVGSDGEDVSSRVNNEVQYVNISLMETTRAYMLLAAMMQLQLTLVDSKLPIAPLPFMLVDPLTGDVCSAAYVTFMDRPSMSKGATVGERVFRLKLSKPMFIYGAANLL